MFRLKCSHSSSCVLLLILFVFPMVMEAYVAIRACDEATVVDVLREEVPELSIDTVELITEGWDHLVAEVNGEWMFRFPKEAKYVAKLKSEKLMLDHLQNVVTTAVPHYSYFGLNTAFGGYRKIQGVALTRDRYLALSAESRCHIAETLALFFTELHRSVSVERAREWGYVDYQLPILDLENDVLGTLPDDIDQMIREALTYIKTQSSSRPVFLHTDLHGENLAFNVVTEQIAGVFDFDAAIGDCSGDLGVLNHIHPELAILAAEIYAHANNIPSPAHAGAVDYILRRAKYLLDARRDGNTERELVQVDLLKDFIPIWNEQFLNRDKVMFHS